jgi:hypothetical protein
MSSVKRVEFGSDSMPPIILTGMIIFSTFMPEQRIKLMM